MWPPHKLWPVNSNCVIKLSSWHTDYAGLMQRFVYVASYFQVNSASVLLKLSWKAVVYWFVHVLMGGHMREYDM